MDTTPKLSVLMSVYNGSQYLKESIESVLNQTFIDFEFIIINDCSSDRTWEILTEYANQDQRIVLINNHENLGLTKSLNKGLKIAKGEYVARQDADDISLSQRFETQVSVLNKHLEVTLVSCNIEVIDSEGNFIGKHQRSCESNLVMWYLLFHNHLAGHSQVIFRREIVMNLGGYCEDYRYAQDYELWCRIVKNGKIIILPEILLQQRRHNQSISTAKSLSQWNYILVQVQRNLKQLTSQEIDLEEIKDLHQFWVGHYWWSNSFPNARRAKIIHTRMKEILKGYIAQKNLENNTDFPTNIQLRILIGKQFILWIHSLSFHYKFKGKLLVSFYAFMWHPLGVLNCWLTDIKTLILRQLIKINIKNIVREFS